MKRTWILLSTLPFILVSAAGPLAQSQEASDPSYSSSCSYGYRCGDQQVDESSDRRPVPGSVPQPRADSAPMGSCGSPLPIERAYKAELDGLRCGSGGDNRPRKPMPIPEDVQEKFAARSSNSRGRSGLEDMQKIRYVDEKIEGTIEYPMTEYWSYEGMDGGQNEARCGTEPVAMTCYRSREERYEYTWTTNDGPCTQWETIIEHHEDALSPGAPIIIPPGSRRDSRSYDQPPELNRPTNRIPPPSYRGESSRESRDEMMRDYRNRMNNRPVEAPARRSNPTTSAPAAPRYNPPSAPRYSPPARSSTSGRRSENGGSRRTRLVSDTTRQVCRAHAPVEHRETRWRPAGRVSYSCVVQRPKYCTWPVRRTTSKACPRQSVPYSVTYTHDPKWVPGYRDPGGSEVRDFSMWIPNKFDLLPGEVEQRRVLLNRGGASNQVNLEVQIDSKYNEYTVNPVSLRCAYKNSEQARFEVTTVGRKMAKAPRLLEVPTDGSALEYERGRPSKIKLIDGGRRDLLDASELSRAFPEFEGVNAEHFKSNKVEEQAPQKEGWWADTRFRIQLFTKDKLDREMSISTPNTFNSNQAEYYMNNLTINLEGQGAMERLYRPSGPFEWALGGLYNQFGMELTPGRTYYVRVQLVNRGIPFYESGCRGGKRVCEGQDATKDSYSEPIDIPFVQDPNIDNRSWFKKLKDKQEETVRY